MTVKEFARLGGLARAKKLNKAERIAIARKGGLQSAANKQKQLTSKKDANVPKST